MPVRVLHATESLASGVMDLLATITRRQADAGADVVLVFASRPDTPHDSELETIFDPRVQLIKVAERDASTAKALLALRRRLRHELKAREYDAVHLHSTLAGLVGRLGFGFNRLRGKTFYSPHGFAFLRQDLKPAMRRLLLALERRASNRGALILSTGSEQQVANDQLGRARCWLVVNGIQTEALPTAVAGSNERPRVAMVGRVTYQKAPWAFAAIADELGDRADFVWFGDGEDADISAWLDGHAVELAGRRPLPQLREELSDFDVFLFPTLWEGMPLSLIEAQSIGLPAVATRIVGNRDIIVDNESGYLCDDDAQLLTRTRELVESVELRRSMSSAALSKVRVRFDDRRIGNELLTIYRGSPVGANPVVTRA